MINYFFFFFFMIVVFFFFFFFQAEDGIRDTSVTGVQTCALPIWSALERLRTGIKPHPFSAFTLSPVHLRPEGRGTVRIKSPDPLAPPAIQFNFLASDYDFQVLIYGTRLSRKIAAQPALKPFVVEEVLPGPAVQTDDDIIEEIRVRGVSNLHPVGTCRMGRENDAVVDPRLKVSGVEGLRVADDSIMTQVPGGNTKATSIMIGAK